MHRDEVMTDRIWDLNARFRKSMEAWRVWPGMPAGRFLLLVGSTSYVLNGAQLATAKSHVCRFPVAVYVFHSKPTL